MASYLIEENVSRPAARDEPQFDNPFTKGAQKIAGGYIEKYLNKAVQEDESNIEDTHEISLDDVDFTY